MFNKEGSFYMGKYSEEFKMKVIEYYLQGNSTTGTAKYFNMPAHSLVDRWVRKFEKHGLAGLIKNKISSYDGDFKRYVVEYMRENHLSATETAIKFNLATHSIVLKWERIYYEKGPQALDEMHCGRPRKMKKDKKKSTQANKDLIAEIEQLRMENEYLKKLNALVQERIKRENKKK